MDDAGPTDKRPPLENQDLPTLPCQVVCADEAVMPRSDDDAIVHVNDWGSSSPWQKGIIVNRGSRVRIEVSAGRHTTNSADQGVLGPMLAS